MAPASHAPAADLPTTTETGQEWPEPAAALLERLSRVAVDALNAGDHDFTRSPAARELRAHFSPNWRGQIDTYAHAREVTFAEQSAMWDQRRAENPDVHFEIVSLNVDVNEKKGQAFVFMDMSVSGLASFKLQAMNELTWKRVDGEWLLFHTLGMRGTRGNAGTGGFG